MATEIPVKVGDVLADKFRIDRVLGAGGMGVVVEATHLALHQRVALKFLHGWAATDAGAIARFEREARAAARLRSKHVVRVMDVGVMTGGQPYMVMEFLEGEDLGHVMKAGRLSVALAVDYLGQICDALAEAHKLGIVHRDLKPPNLFVTTDNNGVTLLKILDFGISKVDGDGDMSLTGTSQILGSPLYMSPEQLRASRDVDPRSDLWSLGAILYEMLTGEVPFLAENMMELTYKVAFSVPKPITAFRDDVPPNVIAAVDACLAKEREQRVGSVADLMRMLAPNAAPISAPTASRPTSEEPARTSAAAKAAFAAETDISWHTGAQANVPAPSAGADRATDTPASVVATPPSGATPAPSADPTPTAPSRTRLLGGVAAAMLVLGGVVVVAKTSTSASLTGTPPASSGNRTDVSVSASPVPITTANASALASAAPSATPADAGVAAPADAPSVAVTMAARATAPVRSPVAPIPPPLAASAKSCSPPYTFTPQGAKQWKPECL